MRENLRRKLSTQIQIISSQTKDQKPVGQHIRQIFLKKNLFSFVRSGLSPLPEIFLSLQQMQKNKHKIDIYLHILMRLLTICLLLHYIVHISTNDDIKACIQMLEKKLQNNYNGKNKKYIFPVQWQHKKGLYQSTIHFNYVDKHNSIVAQQLRSKIFKVEDINMFVTNFVLFGLLEAHALGTIKIDQHQLSQSVLSINDFRDKNSEKGLPKYVFWPQQLVNGTWSATPINLIKVVDKMPTLPPLVADLLYVLGMGLIAGAKDFKKAFAIPPDTDDSSVNLALLGFLKEIKSPHYEFWNSLNYKKHEFYYDHVLRYAYRPFDSNYSRNPSANQIDPRTYFIIRSFLDKRKQEAFPNQPWVILPTTWLITTQESVQSIEQMPFQVNNVDATVTANFLFGLIYQVLSKQITLQNDQLLQMMFDSTDLLCFTVQKLIRERPDLILVYYPSKYDFYWFVARIVQLLKRQPTLQPELQVVRAELELVMKKTGTQHILEEKVSKGVGNHWAQFLGNYANKTRNDDAVFSTALVLNALIDTWATRDGSQMRYDEDVSDEVKDAINGGIEYLKSQIGTKIAELNAFFSGSVKNSFGTLPFFFPITDCDNKDKKVDPQASNMTAINSSLRCYVKGYIEKPQYEEFLKQKWFSVNVQTKMISFNEGKGLLFPFWSAQSITEVMSITALSKFMKLSETNS